MTPTGALDGTVLGVIAASTRRRVAAAKAEIPASELREAALRAPRPLPLADALAGPAPRVIAEVKLASPSAGRFGAGVDPVALAETYARNGAAAVSVLTEPEFFGGGLDVLAAVRARVSLPLLMKDFVLDEYQLLQARAHGAGGVLLICALLDARALAALVAAAAGLGLTPLVEVHDEHELARAAAAGAAVVGVNNRDLRTLETDLAVSRRLAAHPAAGRVTLVSESGIRSRREVDELAALGYRGFLVGTHLVRSGDPGAALRDLTRSAPEGGEA